MRREMTAEEANILNFIVHHGSYEHPIPAHIIREEFGMSKRRLEIIIEQLRVDFKHPIVARKFSPFGYFLPKNEEEREACILPYARQILTEQKNLAAIRSVNLDEYWGREGV